MKEVGIKQSSLFNQNVNNEEDLAKFRIINININTVKLQKSYSYYNNFHTFLANFFDFITIIPTLLLFLIGIKEYPFKLAFGLVYLVLWLFDKYLNSDIKKELVLNEYLLAFFFCILGLFYQIVEVIIHNYSKIIYLYTFYLGTSLLLIILNHTFIKRWNEYHIFSLFLIIFSISFFFCIIYEFDYLCLLFLLCFVFSFINNCYRYKTRQQIVQFYNLYLNFYIVFVTLIVNNYTRKVKVGNVSH